MKFIQNTKGFLENVTGYDPNLLHCLDKSFSNTLQKCNSEGVYIELFKGHVVKAAQINNTFDLSIFHNVHQIVNYAFNGANHTLHFVIHPIVHMIFFN